MSIDTAIQGYVSGLNTPIFFWISLSIYIAIGLVLAYFVYKKDKINFGKLVIGFILMWLVIEILKIITGRMRPDLSDNNSFPSRHAGIAFFIAGFLPVERKYKILLFIWAILVGISRLALNLHWFTDVLVGSILGLSFAYGIEKIPLEKILKRSRQ